MSWSLMGGKGLRIFMKAGNGFVDGVVLQMLMQSLYLGLKTKDLPKIKKEGPYKSEEEYLNTYFRLLREECFHKLREGIYDFVKNGYQSSSKDITMYRYKQIAVLLSHRMIFRLVWHFLLSSGVCEQVVNTDTL